MPLLKHMQFIIQIVSGIICERTLKGLEAFSINYLVSGVWILKLDYEYQQLYRLSVDSYIVLYMYSYIIYKYNMYVCNVFSVYNSTLGRYIVIACMN